jgi:RND family efflux transporter MFP subunit
MKKSLLIVCMLLLTACGEGKKEQKTEAPRPVLIQTVTLQPRVEERQFVATIRPRFETDLSFRVSSKVAKRLVDVGQTVQKGQVLATLDETDLVLQREQTSADLAAAKASLDQAELELTRVTTLKKDGWSATAVVERQRAATEEARGRVLRSERAQRLAANALSYATLVAETEGSVTATFIDSGQVVTAGQPAIRLAQNNEIEAVVSIPETLLDRARSSVARVTLWKDGQEFAAQLRELASVADPATRTYQARYTLIAPNQSVKWGMTATVHLKEASDVSVARLPLSALFEQGGGMHVWIVDKDGKLALKPVTAESYEARTVLISKGVQNGDRVVILGVHKLEAAQAVKIIDAATL